MAAEGIIPAIAEKIQTKTEILPTSWEFKSKGVIIINHDTEIATHGNIVHDNLDYNLGPAIKMKDWHFTYECKSDIGRRKFPDSNGSEYFFITAFYKNYHCDFGIMIFNDTDAVTTFTNLVISMFGPILMPEVSAPLLGNLTKVHIEWKPDPFNFFPVPPFLLCTAKTYYEIPFS